MAGNCIVGVKAIEGPLIRSAREGAAWTGERPENKYAGRVVFYFVSNWQLEGE